MDAVTSKLVPWKDVKDESPWPALLVGNGASQAVWPRFGYASLRVEAQFKPENEALFAAAGTDNFEAVLRSANVVPKWQMTLVHYVHGGLHLYRRPDGTTVKRVAPAGKTLLSLLGTSFEGMDLPLFVSEGTSADKLRTIESSDYLRFVYGKFADDHGDLVVFGHSLGPEDTHLVDAIRRHRSRNIAIGIKRVSARQVVAEKVRLLDLFAGMNVKFYNAATHPLGRGALNCMPVP